MSKAKLVNQLFREGLKSARLRYGADRGRELDPPELGSMVGVSGQTIRNYESGHSEPELLMIEKLRVALKAPPEWPPFVSYVPANHPSVQQEPNPKGIPVTPKRRAKEG